MDEMDISNSPIVFARKPLEENTVVDNVLKWGTGGINIDESRIPTDDNLGGGATNGSVLDIEGFDRPWMHDTERMKEFGDKMKDKVNHAQTFGRFPANLILDTEAAKVLDEQTGVLSNTGSPKKTDSSKISIFGAGLPGKIYSDVGGASRFFYQPKGDEDYENTDKKENNMRLLLGDCLDKLKELEDNSVDSIVTDPPYGLSFMGKQWDYDVPSTQIWEECMRVLKPGGHLLAFAGSRTYHRMAVRIEDAGFEIRDMISWLYGSGFPKSMDISKQIDKKFGKLDEREVVGIKQNTYDGSVRNTDNHRPPTENASYDGWGLNDSPHNTPQTSPATDEAKQWSGWGTALKPAHEPVVMARKPLSEKTVAENVLEWGTGGINIDESRIPTDEDQRRPSKGGENGLNNTNTFKIRERTVEEQPKHDGRFPANLILDEEAGEMLDEQTGVLSSGFMKAGTARLMSDNPNKNTYGKWNPDTVANDTYGDSGGASRFFYCPKVSKSERNEGLGDFPIKQSSSMSGRRSPEDMSAFKIDNDVTGRFVTERQNIHPTVKPVDLMLYLIRLVTPKGGVTLDPFMGSGSSGKAAVRGGFDFIGIEREDEYFKIAEARIEYERNKPIIVETPTGKKVEVEKKVEEKVNQFFG
jgi:site-specific DNA-methyltransferase (adenine-specific)